MQVSALSGTTGNPVYAALELTTARKQSIGLTTAGDTVTLSLAETETAQVTLYTAGGASDGAAGRRGLPGPLESLRQLVATLLEALADGDETTLQVLGVSTTDTEATSDLDYSPEATAGRILSFAFAGYDGRDRGEYAAMAMKAVMKGVRQAAAALGGTLPQAAFDTVALVEQGLREFAAGA